MNNLTTQRELIIKLLQEAGDRGVLSYFLTYEHHIKQAPTRVYELRKLGFNIISKPYKNSVRYILSNQPKDHIQDAPKMVQQWEQNQTISDRLVKVVKGNKVYWEDRKEPEQLQAI